jgi:hypothetical protein
VSTSTSILSRVSDGDEVKGKRKSRERWGRKTNDCKRKGWREQ